jgi:hypothetical protein
LSRAVSSRPVSIFSFRNGLQQLAIWLPNGANAAVTETVQR